MSHEQTFSEEAERSISAEYRKKKVSQSSRKTYSSPLKQFLVWLLRHRPHLVNEEFSNFVGDLDQPNSVLNKKVGDYVRDSESLGSPIKFNLLQCSTFFLWCSSRRKTDGKRFRMVTYQNARSAIKLLASDLGQKLHESMEDELSVLFQGLKRDLAETRSRNNEVLRIGKEALPFDLYVYLNEELLKEGSTDFVFAKCYLCLSWNLMCRSTNAAEISQNHLSWHNDAMKVFFGKQKNDQSGDKSDFGRHVYANPLQPAICPILSLGLYWASFEFEETEKKIFPGNPNERFRKVLNKLLSQEEVASELERRGVEAKDFGSHSTRKGSATYASSGSTSCPSNTAVHLRAGWSMPGVDGTYKKFQAAGDQHVGRTVSGLPTETADFAELPPFFPQNDPEVRSAVSSVFFNIPDSLNFVAEYCLASIVKHSEYIMKEVGEKHRVFSSPLFTDPHLLESLKKKLGLERDAKITATGVPPHVTLLKKFEHVTEQLVALSERIEVQTQTTVKELIKNLNEKALTNNHLTLGTFG